MILMIMIMIYMIWLWLWYIDDYDIANYDIDDSFWYYFWSSVTLPSNLHLSACKKKTKMKKSKITFNIEKKKKTNFVV